MHGEKSGKTNISHTGKKSSGDNEFADRVEKFVLIGGNGKNNANEM